MDSIVITGILTCYNMATVYSIVITETPLPDLEDITGRAFQEQKKEEEEEDDTDCDDVNDLEEEILDGGTEASRKNSFLLVKKLILPEVL